MPVKKRPDNGNWLLSFYWPDGSRYRKTYKAADYTKRELEALERRLRSEGRKKTKGRTWLDLAGRYWKEHAAHLRWARVVKQHLEMLSNEIGDKTKLEDISTDTITEIFAEWRGEISDSTLNRRLAVLRGAWKMATEVWEWQMPSLAWKRLRYREPETIERNISQKEQARLLAACPPYLRDIVEFALRTGLRRGAIMDLSWSDVKADRGVIMAIGKGRKANPIPITRGVQTVLDRLHKSESGPLFTRNGEAIKSFTTAWNFARIRADLPTIRFHDLRHTYAQRMMDVVGDMSIVQDALHHTNPGTTRRYAHRRVEQIRKALEMVELQENGPKKVTISDPSLLSH